MVIKTLGGQLAAYDDDSAAALLKFGAGQVVKVSYTRVRNPAFHRKAFALFKFAFDIWDAPVLEYKGLTVAKEFNGFRKDITILAGFYTAHTRLDGTPRIEAKSLSFGNMNEDEFSRVYAAVLNVIWSRVLKSRGYDAPEKVDAVINRLMAFE